MSEQFKNSIEGSQRETQLIPLTHKYMSAHFPGLIDTDTSMKCCVMGPNLLGKVVKTKSLTFQRILLSHVQRIDVTITYIYIYIYVIECVRHVSAITAIRYAQTIIKLSNLNVFRNQRL